MSKFNFEKYWKELIKGMDENPPESVWDNIQDELDIDEVWSQIDQNIPAPGNYWNSGFRYFLKTAAVLLLLFVPKNERATNDSQELFSFSNSTSSLNTIDSIATDEFMTLNSADKPQREGNDSRKSQKRIELTEDTIAHQAKAQEEKVATPISEDEELKKIADVNEVALIEKEQKQSDSKLSFARKEFNAVDPIDTTNKLSGVQRDNEFASKNEKTEVSRVIKNEAPDFTNSNVLLTEADQQIKSFTIEEIGKEPGGQLAQNSEKSSKIENTLFDEKQDLLQQRVNLITDQKLDKIKPAVEWGDNFKMDTIKGVAQSEHFEDNERKQAIQFSGVGINGAIKNSRLINNDTRAANSGKSLSNTSFTLAKDLGISVQWNTRRSQILQLSYYFVSESAQTYNQYIEARYGQRTLKVNYQTVSAEFIQRIQLINASVIVGPYISRIQSVEESVIGRVRDFTNDYQDWEYGFNLGIQYRYKLSKNISVQPSVKFQYGLNNIFKGNNLIPANFNNTNPMNLSFGIGIYYHLDSK